MQCRTSPRTCWWFGLCALVLAAGCGRREPQIAPAKPTEVVITPARLQEVADYEEFTGRIKAIKGVDVRAHVTGYLDKILFKDGDPVHEGDVLFEIDPRTYKAELARAEATANQARARVKRLNADHHRAQELRVSRSISQEEFDKVAGDLDEAGAALRSAEASRDLAKLNVDYTKVVAPFSGVLSDRRLDTGNLIKADDTVLTRIVVPDPVHAYFDLDERTILRLRRLIREGRIRSIRDSHAVIHLALSDEEEFTHDGTFDFTDNEFDSGTGTLRVRGLFPNPATPSLPAVYAGALGSLGMPNGPGVLLASAEFLYGRTVTPRRMMSPNMFVRVRLPIGTPHPAVVVPERTLGSDQGQKFVFVVRDQQDPKAGETAKVVETRKVKVGTLSKGIRVIEEGLSVGEMVIANGLQRVRHGARVVAKLDSESDVAHVAHATEKR